jgi:DNA topoisomerase-1
VSDAAPGFTRRRCGRGFAYCGADGRAIHDAGVIRRIRGLAIPPAWRDVWICPDPNGHLQAVGYDVRGRKQYRYHPRWREVRDQTKFEHLLDFAQALPAIRARVQADLRLPGLPRDKVLAAVVRLMECTLGRVGNTEYARENDSFGLTTLRRRHVRLRRGRIELDYQGKHGVRYHQVVSDATLARIVRRCTDLPGSELFQYTDEQGRPHRVSSEHVNRYLREASGRHITAKDFRTWAATNLSVLAALALGEARPTRRSVVQIVQAVAGQLGNTPAVCRKSYIHPLLLADYLAGTLQPQLRMLQAARTPQQALAASEKLVTRLLQRWRQ